MGKGGDIFSHYEELGTRVISGLNFFAPCFSGMAHGN